jgi:uncharacterized protein YeaO (DUF488 family)
VIRIKRVYLDWSKEDGFRILVDRLWPRGLTKERAHVDTWLKDIAPSDALRKWFHHEPRKWVGFEKRYRAQLKLQKDAIAEIKGLEKKDGTVTLIYGSKDEKENQAVVLANVLKGRK